MKICRVTSIGFRIAGVLTTGVCLQWKATELPEIYAILEGSGKDRAKMASTHNRPHRTGYSVGAAGSFDGMVWILCVKFKLPQGRKDCRALASVSLTSAELKSPAAAPRHCTLQKSVSLISFRSSHHSAQIHSIRRQFPSLYSFFIATNFTQEHNWFSNSDNA